MLRCVSRYGSAGLGILVEPGEVLNVSQVVEEQLLRDSPESFERITHEEASAAVEQGYDAPPADKMIKRESARRKAPVVETMGVADHPGLVRG